MKFANLTVADVDIKGILLPCNLDEINVFYLQYLSIIRILIKDGPQLLDE